MRGLKAGAMAALMLVLVVCSLCAAPADATFLPWLNFWKKGMMGYPAYPAYKGAKTYDAQGASAASAAAASPPVAEAAFVDLDLGLGIEEGLDLEQRRRPRARVLGPRCSQHQSLAAVCQHRLTAWRRRARASGDDGSWLMGRRVRAWRRRG